MRWWSSDSRQGWTPKCETDSSTDWVHNFSPQVYCHTFYYSCYYSNITIYHLHNEEGVIKVPILMSIKVLSLFICSNQTKVNGPSLSEVTPPTPRSCYLSYLPPAPPLLLLLPSSWLNYSLRIIVYPIQFDIECRLDAVSWTVIRRGLAAFTNTLYQNRICNRLQHCYKCWSVAERVGWSEYRMRCREYVHLLETSPHCCGKTMMRLFLADENCLCCPELILLMGCELDMWLWLETAIFVKSRRHLEPISRHTYIHK